jgi:hypothetical protein
VTPPINRDVFQSPVNFFEKQYANLEFNFSHKTQLSLDKQDAAFTRSTFKELILDAKEQERDYIFALAEDSSNKIHFFDGPSYCQWMKQSGTLKNPFTNVEILRAHFFFIANDLSLEDINEGTPIPYLCSLTDYLGATEDSFLRHIFLRVSADGGDNGDILGLDLILDLYLGRGILPNLEKCLALMRVEINKKFPNPYAQLLAALFYRKGIGFDYDPAAGNKFFNYAQLALSSSEETSNRYSTLEALIEKAALTQDENHPEMTYLSQRYYSLLNI